MLAEYVLAEKSIMDKKTKGLLVGIKDGETGKTPEKKVPTPDRAKRPEGLKKSEPAGVKPVTERARKPELKKANDLFKVANNRSKPMADSPSNRTRGAKRKAEEPSDGEGKHRRRKLQLQEEEEDESSEQTSGETLGSGSDETTASSDSGDGTKQSTPPYKQDDSKPESEKPRKKFGGRIVEEEPESSTDGDAATDLNPLLGALEDVGELQRVEQMEDGMDYTEDAKPAEVLVKDPARLPFIPKKPQVQQGASRLGLPELTTDATEVLEEQTEPDEAQLDTVMEESQMDQEQTGWESVEARPAHIRKNTKDVRFSTMVNQVVTSEIHHLEKRIQENEVAIRESDRELATTMKAASGVVTTGGSRVTQAQTQTTTGLLIQMETLNPNQLRSVQATSVPVSQQGHPDYWIRAQRTDSIGRPWLQQVPTPGVGASRPHSGCTRERQASGSGELPGDTPATAIDPEETNSPPKAAPTTGS
ncbi:hypothetical protein R1sor_023712 [Riccia sorocarpa]|uniref:Uncharacterized protein n=1 Tax=Riccia sorocarpa TaxID=122646 RepID=A0ABD3GSG4_9MARC